ncbi:hypothetical protein BE11_49200 [Sorangium cellulosum]|nr:hypothetical protein BE11_49200 [Sorangium cellulosum]
MPTIPGAPSCGASAGVSPFAPSIASPAVTSTCASSASTSATATPIDDPPGSVALAAVTAKLLTFAPLAPSASVSATAPEGPAIPLRACSLHVHPASQSKPPITSTPASITTLSPNGLLAHASTRLPFAFATASPSDAYGLSFVPSPPASAVALANTAHSSVTVLAPCVGSASQSGFGTLPPVPSRK